MSRPPRLHIRTATKGTSKTSPISRFDEDVNAVFDSIFASRMQGLVKFDVPAVKQRLMSDLVSMYVEGIRENIGALIGGYMSNPTAATGWSLGDPNLGIDRNFRQKTVLGFKNLPTLLPGSEQLRYHPLSKQTVKLKALINRKGGKPNLNRARAFFLDSGDLKRRLLKGVRAYVKRTGVVQVTIKARNNGRFVKITDPKAQFRLADMQIKLLPRVSGSMLPGLQSGNWTHDSGSVDFERMLGFDSETLRKLNNTGDSYAFKKRPLMQPIFTFYTLYRAPAVIARGLPDLIQKVL